MKKRLIFLITLTLMFPLIGCSKESNETVFNTIQNSAVAKLELPNESFVYVDSEIASLRSFVDLDLVKTELVPYDNESDWIYRIIFNPSEKVTNNDEIIVSFYETYIQIGSEYYLTAKGVKFDSVLEWVSSKFEYFIK